MKKDKIIGSTEWSNPVKYSQITRIVFIETRDENDIVYEYSRRWQTKSGTGNEDNELDKCFWGHYYNCSNEFERKIALKEAEDDYINTVKSNKHFFNECKPWGI